MDHGGERDLAPRARHGVSASESVGASVTHGRWGATYGRWQKLRVFTRPAPPFGTVITKPEARGIIGHDKVDSSAGSDHCYGQDTDPVHGTRRCTRLPSNTHSARRPAACHRLCGTRKVRAKCGAIAAWRSRQELRHGGGRGVNSPLRLRIAESLCVALPNRVTTPPPPQFLGSELLLPPSQNRSQIWQKPPGRRTASEGETTETSRMDPSSGTQTSSKLRLAVTLLAVTMNPLRDITGPQLRD
ncbi:unnamed protein product [Lampetra planeri]